MDKTKTVRFSNLNNFRKKFRKIEPKIKNKKVKFELNFLDFYGNIQYNNSQNLEIYYDDECYGLIMIMDIFELKIYIKTDDGSEECYIIKSEDVE